MIIHARAPRKVFYSFTFYTQRQILEKTKLLIDKDPLTTVQNYRYEKKKNSLHEPNAQVVVPQKFTFKKKIRVIN
jgi:hypothetical protein